MFADLTLLLAIMMLLVWMRKIAGPAFQNPPATTLKALFLLPFFSVAVLYATGFYRLVTRHIGRGGVWHIGYAMLLATMAWALLVFLAAWRGGLVPLPRTVVIAYVFAGWVAIWMLREFASWWLRDLPLDRKAQVGKSRTRVLIYGAGDLGVALLGVLRESARYDVRGFLEQSPSMRGMKVHGLPVHGLQELEELLRGEGVEEIILSTPQLTPSRKRNLVRKLARYPVRLRMVSDPAGFVTDRIGPVDLKDIDIDDLLGRDPVRPLQELMRANISDKSVMITGAGGSIGAQIVRTALACGPRKIVLFELSELALYKIEQELSDILRERGDDFPRKPKIVPVLGSVGNDALVRRTLRDHAVNTIYHAAAYKHIPLLEVNVSAATENNVLATATLARAARDCGVERMVLISSDKAVRPANVKGATNRLQELILQACAEESSHDTVFAAVRFGNVLGSSGSVVPRFREQIEKGGPVTVTHPEITRYFMSIREAAELVIQAGAMANSGDIFALDMGKPIRIMDLARLMIHLSGLEVADDDNPNGDIELKIIGPRPGDKLREELLIDGNVVGTRHPFIVRLNERLALDAARVREMLRQLKAAVEANDISAIQAILRKHVEGYSPAAMHQAPAPSPSEAAGKVVSLSDFMD